MMWLDFGMFIVMLGLFLFVFAANTITVLHKIYMALHIVFMFWPLFQFIAQTVQDTYRVMFLQISYISLSLIGVGWFVFVVVLTGQANLIRKGRLILLMIPGLMSSVLASVNPNGWFVSVNSELIAEKQLQSGPLFWYMVIQLTLYLTLSVFIMLHTLSKEMSVRQRTLVKTAMTGMFMLVLFALIDTAYNIVFVEKFPYYIPFNSVGLTVSAVYLVNAITRNRVLDIIQVVQRDVMNTISTGIIVLDENDVIIETNKSIKPFLKLRIGERFDRETVSEMLPRVSDELADFFQAQNDRPLERVEVELALDFERVQYVILQSAPILAHRKKTPIGRLLTVHDVTELRMLVEETNVQNELLQDRNRELMEMQDELSQANKKLQHMTITDSLTGCFNRRYLMQQLEHEVAVNVRYGIPFSIFLFDIDLFKSINDKHGHLVGDEVICGTADAVKGTLRLTDILARYGGEEFTVYLPHTNREQADLIADRVKEAVEHNHIYTGNGTETVSVTISMGVVSVEQFDQSVLDNPKAFLRELLSQADAALYEAKYNGRNRIVKRKLA
ncbi:diguanylate cyclase [Paenibacillus sp. NPDC058071]|uniref:histidine kinase N-terminal 7TM domain-containing diguanylate cyclase n=1 Tax=Paenibacillus sp. NPDC058071 TaxID=3346326 RepID=UPI0036D8F781